MEQVNYNDIFADYPDIVSVDDLAKMLGIGRNAAYKLLQDGQIQSFRIGRCYKIPKKSIIDYVFKNNVQ
jgi:excisionase family DNA binding protein